MNFSRSLLSTLVVTTLVLHIAEGQDVYNEFFKFIEKYGKTYLVGTTEFKEKFINFQVCYKYEITQCSFYCVLRRFAFI